MAVRARYNKKIQVNLTEETFEEVKELADDEGVSNAEIIRKAVEEWFNNRRQHTKAA